MSANHAARLRAFGLRVRSIVGRALGSEDGQGMTEYALVTTGLLVGAGVSLFFFIPQAIQGYRTYILGFYLVLGLPFP
jgi:hypothetical protein